MVRWSQRLWWYMSKTLKNEKWDERREKREMVDDIISFVISHLSYLILLSLSHFKLSLEDRMVLLLLLFMSLNFNFTDYFLNSPMVRWWDERMRWLLRWDEMIYEMMVDGRLWDCENKMVIWVERWVEMVSCDEKLRW